MKKIILLVLVALSVVMCSAKKADTPGTETKPKAEQVMPTKIVVGLDDTFAPMGFKDDKGETMLAFYKKEILYAEHKRRNTKWN